MISPLQHYLTSPAERGAGPGAPVMGEEPMSYGGLGLETKLMTGGGRVMNHNGMQTDDAGVLELIRDRLNIDVVDVHVDLIETGMIDSLALVTLITALEDRFGCEFPLDDFDFENFRSARRITQYLAASGVLDTRSAS